MSCHVREPASGGSQIPSAATLVTTSTLEAHTYTSFVRLPKVDGNVPDSAAPLRIRYLHPHAPRQRTCRENRIVTEILTDNRYPRPSPTGHVLKID